MIDVSPFLQTLNGKPVAVYGLGLSNMSAIRALVAAGARVVAGDDDPGRLAAANDLGAETLADIPNTDFSSYACLILAPGIPFTHEPHPVVQGAQSAGIEILCDIKILHRCNPGRTTVGVTGTNGKSTTTALVGHILETCGKPCAIGGNIGTPALDMDWPPEGGTVVLELSSFQLDLCPTFAPDIAVLLNLSPDHLDRHGTMEAYEAAKLRIFRGAGAAVIAMDDERSRQMAAMVEFAGRRTMHPLPAQEGQPVPSPTLPGVHNAQNVAAATMVARLLGCTAPDIADAIAAFPGLQHRQFHVRDLNGVAYINDSKATNADATARALACYDNIYWIAGGKPKVGGLDGLEGYMPRIHHAFLIGEAADDFAAWMKRRGVPHTICHTLDRAVAAAQAMAQSGGTVLLSPACASFDQFRNFEARGDLFTRLVETLS